MVTKVCNICNETKSHEDFMVLKSAIDGHKPICKICNIKTYANETIRNHLLSGGKNIPTKISKQLKALNLKRCPTCDDILSIADGFYNGGKRGAAYQCIICQAKREARPENKESRSKYRGKTKDEKFTHYLKYKFNITLTEYNNMVVAQNNLCAICNSPPNPKRYKGRLCVDHDHQTNFVRGLLCDKCNFGLGQFDDDINLMHLAISYLRSSQTRQKRILAKQKDKVNLVSKANNG